MVPGSYPAAEKLPAGTVEQFLILSLCADGASALGVLRSSRKLYRRKGVGLECKNPYLVVPVPGRFSLALAKGFKMVKWGFLVHKERRDVNGNLNRQKRAYGVYLWRQKK